MKIKDKFDLLFNTYLGAKRHSKMKHPFLYAFRQIKKIERSMKKYDR